MIITNSVNPKLTQALSLISNIYRYQLGLSADSNTIAQAMMIVTQKTEQLKTLNMLDEKIAGFQSLEEEDKTTNGVF